MIAILGSLIGFLTSSLPAIIKIFQDKSDKAHEITLLQMQIDYAKLQLDQNLTQVEIGATADQLESLYKTYSTGIRWVDALNGSVRPVLSYAFFILYAGTKYLQYDWIPDDAPLFIHNQIMWTENDSVIFCSIISFYFGSRFFDKK